MLNKTLSALALTTALVATQSAAELDLTGETVEWIIPFSETGGSAKWANFYAPLLSEALPGNPTVVVTFNPGAGSTKGANAFQEMAYEDGTIGMLFLRLAQAALPICRPILLPNWVMAATRHRLLAKTSFMGHRARHVLISSLCWHGKCLEWP